MRRMFAALLAGLLFGAGLVVSHMVGPLKVQAFLDVAGDWDPSLAFVMATAIPVAALGVLIGRRTRKPLLAQGFAAPPGRTVDVRLFAGAAIFGTGWGLVGYCPGPALAALGNGTAGTMVFVAAMLAGMAAFRLLPLTPPRRRGVASPEPT